MCHKCNLQEDIKAFEWVLGWFEFNDDQACNVIEYLQKVLDDLKVGLRIYEKNMNRWRWEST